MNRDLAFAIEFSKAPKELQAAAQAAYDADQAYEANAAKRAKLLDESTALLQASNDASATYNKMLKAWADSKAAKQLAIATAVAK